MSGLVFNARDVFEIAKKIEQNGQAFYERAAEIMPNQESSQLMKNLAAMEREHEKLFSEMEDMLSGDEADDTVYDPHDDAYAVLKRMGDQFVFHPQDPPNRVFETGASVEEILDVAIDREKDSILFYEGIKVMVPEKYGRSRIDDIIAEEMGHLIALSREKERMRTA